MKSNIDLTDNRDFRRDVFNTNIHIASLLSSNSLERHLDLKILDVKYYLADVSNMHQRGGIIQGNATYRMFEKINEGEENHCMRCGRIRKYPWEDFAFTLCPKCNEIIGEVENIFDYVSNNNITSSIL